MLVELGNQRDILDVAYQVGVLGWPNLLYSETDDTPADLYGLGHFRFDIDVTLVRYYQGAKLRQIVFHLEPFGLLVELNTSMTP